MHISKTEFERLLVVLGEKIEVRVELGTTARDGKQDCKVEVLLDGVTLNQATMQVAS